MFRFYYWTWKLAYWLIRLSFQNYPCYHMSVKLKHISTCSAVLFLHESYRDSGLLRWDWWLLNCSKSCSCRQSTEVGQSTTMLQPTLHMLTVQSQYTNSISYAHFCPPFPHLICWKRERPRFYCFFVPKENTMLVCFLCQIFNLFFCRGYRVKMDHRDDRALQGRWYVLW